MSCYSPRNSHLCSDARADAAHAFSRWSRPHDRPIPGHFYRRTTIISKVNTVKSQFQNEQQRFRRVDAWSVVNPTLVPPPEGDPATWSPLTRMRQGLNVVAARMAGAAVQQEVQGAAWKLSASDEPALRAHLRDELRVVTQMARTLGKTVPGITTLKIPGWSLHSESFIKSADALITRAAVYESVLVEHGLAPDFVAQLRQAIAALKADVDARGVARAQQVNATAQLQECVKLGRTYVAQMDALLSKALRSDAPKLREWNNVKRAVVKGVAGSVNSGASSMLTAPAGTTPASVPGSSGEGGASDARAA